MAFFSLSIRQLSALGLLLLLGLVAMLLHSLTTSSWASLLTDKSRERSFQFAKLTLVNDIPISDDEVMRILEGGHPSSEILSIEIFAEDAYPIFGTERENFSSRLRNER